MYPNKHSFSTIQADIYDPAAGGLQRQQGMALIISLIMLILISMITITALRTSLMEEKISGNQKLAVKAMFAAEQGVSQATEYLYDSTFMTSQLPVWEADPTQWYSDSVIYGNEEGDEPKVYKANYQVRPLLNSANEVVTESGISYYRIKSIGTSGPDDARASRTLDAVISTLGGDNLPYPNGLIGCDGVLFKSNATTSSQPYDSTTEYSDLFPASDDDPPGDGDKGDVRTTNDNDHVNINLDSNIKIEGELRSTGKLSIKGGLDTWVRRDVIANEDIKLEESFTIFGSIYTNSDLVDKDGGVTVNGEINKGTSVVPVPLVPYDPEMPCDPMGLSDEFFNVVLADGNWINRGYDEIDSTDNPYGDDDPDTVIKYRFTSKDGKDDEPAFYMKGDSKVIIKGDVVFYLDGLFWIDSKAELMLEDGASLTVYVRDANTDKEKVSVKSGALVNYHNGTNYGDPSSFVIITDAESDTYEDGYTYGDKPDVYIDSNAVVFGQIYAPKADIKMSSNASVYGAVRGWHVTLDSNADFVYEEGLDSKGSGTDVSAYRRIYINEKY